MVVKKNKKGTFDLSEMSLGKLMAIVDAIDKLETKGNITSVQDDVRNLIKNNPDYQKALTGN